MRLVLINDSPTALERAGLTPEQLDSLLRRFALTQWRQVEKRLSDGAEFADADGAALLRELRAIVNGRDPIGLMARDYARIEREIGTGARALNGQRYKTTEVC